MRSLNAYPKGNRTRRLGRAQSRILARRTHYGKKSSSNSWMIDEDWFNLGKADAWTGRAKQPPEHSPLAASMYDLGYSEGKIKRSPID
jgi:hypothetical protein